MSSSLDALNICASGMTAQRVRMDTIAQNIANVNTTREYIPQENGALPDENTGFFFKDARDEPAE